ncbi:MAG: peptidase T [Spirochaetia bacterium]|nr:peptidase T [Spirochaetia bacterium]
MFINLKEDLKTNFLKYTVVDTMSDEKKAEFQHPSSLNQLDLINMLKADLEKLNIEDVSVGKEGVLVAHIPATVEGAPCIGLMAHVDTADDVEGNGVKPQVIEKYDGKDIVLGNSSRIIKKDDNPELENYINSTIFTSDGNTLLGADDKAGVSEIMTIAKILVENKDIKHGEIEIIFTCDEETGCGMDAFPYERIHCDYCYTIDGGTRYEIESECFNASKVSIDFKGVSYHLGAAKGKMVNALTMATTLVNSLPQAESPEATDNRDGYYCPLELNATNDEAHLVVYLRDFELSEIERRENVLKSLCSMVEQIYPGGKTEINFKRQYYNMKDISKKNPKVLDSIFEAGRRLEQPLFESPIRGGTDGARMANEKGIPCPNIYTGGHNYHSYYEWCALNAMEDAVKLILEIIKIGAEK